MKRLGYLICPLLVIGMLGGCITPPSYTNEIYIYPSTITVTTDNVTEFLIMCTPIQPIKAYEFELQIDNQVIWYGHDVGTIWSGYDSVFTSSNMRDENGTIKPCYGLLFEKGMVSSKSGSLSIFKFRYMSTGTHYITLKNVHLYNLTSELPVTIRNSVVTVTQGVDEFRPIGGFYE